MESRASGKKKPAAKLEQIIMQNNERQTTEKTQIHPNNDATSHSICQQSITIQDAQQLTTVLPDSTSLIPNVPKQLKKRGRKRKIPIDEKYNNPEYVVMWPEICMAQKVLVDRYDNVYTYDLESPIWLGVKTVYGKIDNTTYKTPLTKYYFQ